MSEKLRACGAESSVYLGSDGRRNRRWQRSCKSCGRSFTATASNVYYCAECGRQRQARRKRERERRIRGTKGVYLGKTAGKRTWKRKCRNCGKTFRTTGSHKFYCDECQNFRYNCQANKKVLGTFGLNYLELYNGRVRGAVLLEKRIAINSRRYYRIAGRWYASKGYEYNVSYLIATYLATYEKIYCDECGAEITIARENQIYTTRELCCKTCGLVYQLA